MDNSESRNDLMALAGVIIYEIKKHGVADGKKVRDVRAMIRPSRDSGLKRPSAGDMKKIKALIFEEYSAGNLTFEGAFRAFSIFWSKGHAEKEVRIPFLVKEEMELQRLRRQVDREFVTNVRSPDDLATQAKNIVSARRFWFYQIVGLKAKLHQLSQALSLYDELRVRLREALAQFASWNREIKAIKAEVNSRNTFTLEQLRELNRRVAELQTMKSDLRRTERLDARVWELKYTRSWINAAEMDIAHEAGAALDGLEHLSGDASTLREGVAYGGFDGDYVVSEETLFTEARDRVANMFRDSADAEPNRLKKLTLRSWADEAESVRFSAKEG